MISPIISRPKNKTDAVKVPSLLETPGYSSERRLLLLEASILKAEEKQLQ
jgi:hypothetical protein